MVKKLTSLLLAVMLLATMTPGVIYAESTTEDISAKYGSYVRGRQDNGSADAVIDGSNIMYVSTASGTDKSNEYFSFLSFDFSGYESKIEAASSIKLKIKAGRYSDSKAGGFTVSVLPDVADNIILGKTTLTYNSLSSNKLHTLGTSVMESTGTLTNGTVVESENIKDYILAALSENPANSTVSFRITGSDSTVSIFYGYANQKISVEYDANSVDNNAYLQTRVSPLEWADISSQSADAITEDISLPSKLCGADVCWISDDEAIKSDGDVKRPKGDAVNVTLTAQFTYYGSTALKEFNLTVLPAELTTETVNHSQKTHIRGGQHADNVQAVSFGEIYVQRQDHNTINDRYAFYQFDLSGYEEKIHKASSATITVVSQQASQPLTITLLPDSCDNWSASTLTFNIANSLGMLENSVPTTERAVQSNISWSANTAYTTNNFAPLLKSALAENGTNSIFTFRLYGDNQTLTTVKHASFKLNLSYYEDELDKDAFFEEVKNSLVWENVSSQEKNGISDNLTLPKKLYGFDIEWSSNNEAINAQTGAVTQAKEAIPVSLTATVKNGDVSIDTAFDLTVLPLHVTSVTFDIADKSATRGGVYGSEIQDLSYSVAFNRIYTRKEGLNDDNDRYIYYSFDLSGYEEEAMKANSVTFTMNKQSSGDKFSVCLLPETDYNWEYETLTYNKSNALGMMDEAYVVGSGLKCTGTDVAVSGNFAEDLKKVLSSNPTSSVITLRIYADRFSEAIEFNAPVPKLNISYYESDLNSDEFFNDIKNNLTWDDITTQLQNEVIANIKLPAKFYGYDVSWISDNEAVITSSGEVKSDISNASAKLTAVISNGETQSSSEFDIKISDRMYAIAFSNDAGSGAWAYSTAETDAVLVFAAYSAGQLVSVDAVAAVLSPGENIIGSRLNVSGADSIKIMLLSNMEALTPLCNYKSK